MSYPWPSFGSFVFLKDETVVFGSDQGWVAQPSYSRSQAQGSQGDSIIVMAAGSRERQFEVILTLERLQQLESLLTTKALFTDWRRPTPDSRMATLYDVQPGDEGFGLDRVGKRVRKRRVRLTLVA